jgi:enamine deaminase RidA (YjgF/YER057c/UK114 family)
MAKPEQVISVYPELEQRFDLSYAVRAGQMLFLSGMVAADEHFNLVGAGDMEAQIRCIYARVQKVLAAAGGSLRHVVSETNYTTDSPALTKFAWVRAEIYRAAGAAMPAATGVHVHSLTLPGALLEVHATAVLD